MPVASVLSVFRHVHRQNLGQLESYGVLQLLLREIVFAMQIQMVPDDDGALLEGGQQGLPSFLLGFLGQHLRQVKLVPANDGVADQSVTPLGDLLLGFLGVEQLLIATKRNRIGKAIGLFPLVELFLNGLPELQ